MKKERGWIERLAEQTDLQDEAFPGQPLVELLGDRRLLIEHHKGVRQYTKEVVQIGVRYGYIQVCGGCLEVTKMTKEQLVIVGRIDAVSIVRRK